ncbi:MAG: hypothetical protein ACPIOQ_70415, partial [Promethearchaeia archaeon]
ANVCRCACVRACVRVRVCVRSCVRALVCVGLCVGAADAEMCVARAMASAGCTSGESLPF